MLDPQNFSVYAGNDFDVFIDVDPDDGITLVGATIIWRAYEQSMGLPTGDPVIEKSNGVDGTLTVDDPDTQTLKIPLTPEDTTDLLRNYCHECCVVDPDRGTITIAHGIMTVLGTSIKETTT